MYLLNQQIFGEHLTVQQQLGEMIQTAGTDMASVFTDLLGIRERAPSINWGLRKARENVEGESRCGKGETGGY